MNTVKLYKNPHPYPHYGGITEYKTIQATPRNQNLKSGYVDMQLSLDEILSFNYVSFTRNGRTVYGWVESVEDIGGNKLWRVHYTTDAFRTYRGDIVLGTQYIERSPNPTLLEDPLLGSTRETNKFLRVLYNMSNPTYRYCVVQTRNMGGGEQSSNTPGQPSPYQFLFCRYNVNNWISSIPILSLINLLTQSGKTSNIVTIYSVPYVDTSRLAETSLSVIIGEETHNISGWYFLGESVDPRGVFSTYTNIEFPEGITKTRHSVKLVFPDAGIMSVPDEYLYYPNLGILQEIDVFSGACNYLLCLDELTPTHISIRGSSLSTIPILSDPYDTYISQNQNTLAVGLLGDTATFTGGVLSGNVSAALAGAGALVNTATGLMDAQNAIPSNPPAFLGSALVSRYNQSFWAIVMWKDYDNEPEVRARYGYPQHRLGELTLPTKGFIQTSNCSIGSNGSVPLWAINEINQLFNAGILFK